MNMGYFYSQKKITSKKNPSSYELSRFSKLDQTESKAREEGHFVSLDYITFHSYNVS